MVSVSKPDSLVSDLLLSTYIQHKEKQDSPNGNDDGDIAKLQVLMPWAAKDEILRQLAILRRSKPGWLAAGSQLSSKLAAPKPIKLDINSLPRASSKKDSSGSEAGSSDRTDVKSQDSGKVDSVSPKITIHVCDEGKGLKQDFECPKDLLVQEMKYFADYLSSDQQKWEDVDISVHCDVNIFDWLMRYVKRNLAGSSSSGSLEPTNVISILISSDFLKMDNLVNLCIDFCHKNMSAILATPCNMSCLSDPLVDRIAARFTDCEVDDIRDKKDKFKHVLFQKKVESLFAPTATLSARSLFRCRHCRQLLTRESQRVIHCHPGRLCVGPRGAPAFRHEADPSFDVNDFLVELKHQLGGNWRSVYWRLWGLVAVLSCSRCGLTFPSAELAHCAHHPSPARFEPATDDAATNSLGVYPCCGVKTLRFDPFRLQTGCKFRDHVITTPSSPAGTPDSEESDGVVAAVAGRGPVTTQEILLAKRDAICVAPPERPTERSLADVDIFGNEYLLLYPQFKPKQHKPAHATRSTAATVAPIMEPLCVDDDKYAGGTDVSDDSDEDDPGDADSAVMGGRQQQLAKPPTSAKPAVGKAERKAAVRSRVTFHAGAILLHAPSFGCRKSGRWDANRSSRANQDYQRQDDRRRMVQIMDYLVKLRSANGDLQRAQPDRAKQKEYSGGMYAKLEAQFKATHTVSAGANKVPPMNPRVPEQRPRTSVPRAGGK